MRRLLGRIPPQDTRREDIDHVYFLAAEDELDGDVRWKLGEVVFAESVSADSRHSQVAPHASVWAGKNPHEQEHAGGGPVEGDIAAELVRLPPREERVVGLFKVAVDVRLGVVVVRAIQLEMPRRRPLPWHDTPAREEEIRAPGGAEREERKTEDGERKNGEHKF